MVVGDVMPVLWLCGPPGVGKTAVGWEIYRALIRGGARAGYVDADQLGMCYPEPETDPGRHRLQARNLAAVLAGYRSAGADCVVVSGVVDASHGVQVEELPRVALTVCRLRADQEHLTQRFLGRGGPEGVLSQVLREAAELDTSAFADVWVDTSGMTVAEAARQVSERVQGWTSQRSPSRGDAAPPADPGEPGTGGADSVRWLCGAPGVGKSTVGFQVYLRTLSAGVSAAYLDLDQIDFCGPGAADHRRRARTAAALWRNFRRAGAQTLVLVGPAPDAGSVLLYADAFSPAEVTVSRLHAGPGELTSRILSRGQGGSWSQPGDPLVGKPAAQLRSFAEQAVREADALDGMALGHRVDTDGRTVEQIADAILARTP